MTATHEFVETISPRFDVSRRTDTSYLVLHDHLHSKAYQTTSGDVGTLRSWAEYDTDESGRLRNLGDFPEHYRTHEELTGNAPEATPERTDLDGLWAALGKEANDRGWCSEYDAFAAQHGGPARPERTVPRMIRVAMPVEVQVPERLRYAEDNDIRDYYNGLDWAAKREPIQRKLDRIAEGGGISPDNFYQTHHVVA